MSNKLIDKLAPILSELGVQQNGFFTEKQAETLGLYSNKRERLKALAASDRWFLVRDGLYRLSNFPPDNHGNITEVYFSCLDRRGWPVGVLSHVTALRMYHLMPSHPADVHITIPAGKAKLAPSGNGIVIHRDSISLLEIEVVDGMYTTSPIRTIVDLVNKSGNRLEAIAVIERALRKAMSKQLITLDALDNVPKKMQRLLQGLARGPEPSAGFEAPAEDRDFDASDFLWLMDGIL